MRNPSRLSSVRRTLALVALLSLPLVASCTSYLPFTDRVADRYRLEPRDRTLLQYFVSDEFCLRRDTTDESAHITAGGTVRFFRGRRIEELRIRRHTPGTVVAMEAGGLGLSFMPGDDRSVLYFAPELDGDRDGASGSGDGPEPERRGRFAVAPEPERRGSSAIGERYVLKGDVTHSVRYDGKLWTVHYERRPYLLIRGRDVEDQETRVKTLPGRRVER
ncbi:MAG: hypothetical protein U1A78_41290 [Polyangia bacterium]